MKYLHTAILLLTIWCGAATTAAAADITIDLSTVTDSDTGGGTYTVTDSRITLTGANNTYIFTQSGGTAAATVRGILVNASCSIRLDGVHLAVSNNADALYVSEACTVNLTFAGDNTLKTTTENAAVSNKGNLTLAGANGNADILRCLAPIGNGINSMGSLTFSSGTVYAEGGGEYNGLKLYVSSSATFTGGTMVATGKYGVFDDTTTLPDLGDSFTLTAYGTVSGIKCRTAGSKFLTNTIRWEYATAPNPTEETLLLVKNSSKNTVRTFRLPAGHKGFACTAPVGDYTLWLHDVPTATNTQLQDANAVTAFTVGNEYIGFTLTETVEKFPVAVYTTAEGEQPPIDFADLTADTAVGLLKDALTLNIKGRWSYRRVRVLRSAIVNSTTDGAGTNDKLTTVTFDADAVMESMYSLFFGCTALTSVTMPTKENTNAVSFYGAFIDCTALKTVDLSCFTNISNMDRTFYACHVLESVKMPTKNNSSVIFDRAFYSCKALKSIDLSAFTNITRMQNTFNGCAALESVIMPTAENTRSVDFSNTFNGCKSLTSAIDLNGFTAISNLTNTFNGCANLIGVRLNGTKPGSAANVFDGVNPECYVHVPADWGAKPADWNVIYIVGGTAMDNIALKDDKLFHCLETFTAGGEVTYTRDFGTEPSGIGGKAAGWETLCLPFTPQEITGVNAAGSQVKLVPFNADGTYEGKGSPSVIPFWLRTLTPDGYIPATKIEPNKPYIIALPNNEAYDPKFNVTGEVIFSAVSTLVNPVRIEATPEVMPPAAGSAYTLHGNYSMVPSAESVYVINTEGTAFVANGGEVMPFRPYVTANSAQNAPAQFVIGKDEGGATAIEEAVLMGYDTDGNGSDGLRVYGSTEPGSLVVEAVAAASTVDVVAIDGRVVRTVSLQEGVNVVNGLAAGVYVVGGQKAVVK